MFHAKCNLQFQFVFKITDCLAKHAFFLQWQQKNNLKISPSFFLSLSIFFLLSKLFPRQNKSRKFYFHCNTRNKKNREEKKYHFRGNSNQQPYSIREIKSSALDRSTNTGYILLQVNIRINALSAVDRVQVSVSNRKIPKKKPKLSFSQEIE